MVGLVVAPAGDRFVMLSADGEVKAWDLAGKELRAWKLPVPANAAAFAPDGKKLVTANRTARCTCWNCRDDPERRAWNHVESTAAVEPRVREVGPGTV